jgi:hypothetical protein
MKNPGPPIEALIDRLISIPEDLITGTSGINNSGTEISLPALVNDLLIDNGGIPLNDVETVKLLSEKKSGKAVSKTRQKSNYPALAAILCYIYEDRFFTEKKNSAESIKKFLLSDGLHELSNAVESAEEFINDPDRREEICRRALDALNYYPQGENEKNSADRLLTLDSVERKKILIKTIEAQKRAKDIHDAMMQKEAEEAASKMSRE